MSLSPELRRELYVLLGRLRDGELDDAQLARLDALVGGNVDARRFYLDYVDLCASLHWARRERDQRRGAMDQRRGMAGSPAIDLPVGTAVELPSGQWPQTPNPEPRTPNPEPPFPILSTTHYPLPTSFVGSLALSNIVATVKMGVAILGFWAYKITHHQPRVAEAPSQSVPSDAMPEMVFVGRITGMVDVKWSDDPHYLPPLSSRAYVPLGREYKLDSGLMEITYDSGAKVILEGPCTYEVESTAGGFLSLGKLTARIGERGEGRGERKKHSDNQKSPSSFILHPSSLFSVRTPTALVTDLGTEFGVEVSGEGNTTSCVFRGSVKVQIVGDGSQKDVVLRENESARVEKGEGNGGPRLVLLKGVDNPPKFVRWLRKPPKVFDPLDIVDGSIFHDDFDGDAVDADKWVAGASDGGTLSVADGTITLHTPADEDVASLTGAAPLDFSASPDDWWAEVRFKIGETLTTRSWMPRHWIVLGGENVPPAARMRGFDLRVIQQGVENSPVFVLGWWGWDHGDEERIPDRLVSNLNKGQFYIVKIHRKPNDKVDVYLDDRLIAVAPLIASQNPDVLKCGDFSSHMNGKLIVDYVKVGVLVHALPEKEVKRHNEPTR